MFLLYICCIKKCISKKIPWGPVWACQTRLMSDRLPKLQPYTLTLDSLLRLCDISSERVQPCPRTILRVEPVGSCCFRVRWDMKHDQWRPVWVKDSWVRLLICRRVIVFNLMLPHREQINAKLICSKFIVCLQERQRRSCSTEWKKMNKGSKAQTRKNNGSQLFSRQSCCDHDFAKYKKPCNNAAPLCCSSERRL